MAIHFPEGNYPYMEADYDQKRAVIEHAYPLLRDIINAHAEPVKLPKKLGFLRRAATEIDWKVAECYIDIERPNHKPKIMMPSIERARITVGDKPEMSLLVADRINLPTGVFLSFVTEYPNGTLAETAFVLNYFHVLMYKRRGMWKKFLDQQGFEGAAVYELPKHLDIVTRAFEAKKNGKILRVNYQEFK